MKTKVLLTLVTMTIGVTCYASDFSSRKNNMDEPEKIIVMDSIAYHQEHEIDGNPCPCTHYSCECGGKLEFSATAYKKYHKNKKCYKCSGKGCEFCDSTGLDWDWVAGCKCKKCGRGYDQPNDC